MTTLQGDAIRDPDRLAALRHTALLETAAEPAFDRLSCLAARILGAPVALISLVDADRQVFKGCVGLSEPWAARREVPLSHSFCQHVVASREPLVIEDARVHPLVRDNLAIRDLGVVAYAGIPLVTAGGHVLGSFCAIDDEPRVWTLAEIETLKDLAAAVMTEVELRVAARAAEHALAARQRAEAALTEQEEQLRLAVDAADLGTWDLDIATGAIECSARCKANFGLPPDALLTYEALVATIHPDDRPGMRAAVERALAERGRYETEYRVTWPDGSLHWVAASGRGIYDEEGRPVRMAGVTAEVTERRRAAEAREQLAAIVESAEDAIISRTLDGTITSWNRGAEQLYGYARDEVIGRPITILVPADRQGELDELAEPLARGDRVEQFETVRQRKDGTTVEVAITLSPLRDAAGRVVGVSTIARDVTERRRAEDERRAFIDAAAHDLRSPLTAILGQAQLLRRAGQRGTLAPEKVETGLRAVESAATRATALIHEMLDAAHLRTGRVLELRREPVDLVGLARACAVERQQTTPRHVLRTETTESELVVSGDRARLERVLANLVANAIKYSPHGGEVVVSVTREERAGEAWAMVAVRDEGVGIPAADLPHVFEHYRRGSNVIGRIGGTGIGLAGARQIVAQHGGTITAASAEGRGSTFTVALPVQPPAEAS